MTFKEKIAMLSPLEILHAEALIKELLTDEPNLLENAKRTFDYKHPTIIKLEDMKSFFNEHFDEIIRWYKKYDLVNEITYAEIIKEKLDEIEPKAIFNSYQGIVDAMTNDIYKNVSYSEAQILKNDDGDNFPNAMRLSFWYQRYFNPVDFFTQVFLMAMIEEGKVTYCGKKVEF